MENRKKNFREEELRKGLPLQPTKFGDQSTLRTVDFKLGEGITAGVHPGILSAP